MYIHTCIRVAYDKIKNIVYISTTFLFWMKFANVTLKVKSQLNKSMHTYIEAKTWEHFKNKNRQQVTLFMYKVHHKPRRKHLFQNRQLFSSMQYVHVLNYIQTLIQRVLKKMTSSLWAPNCFPMHINLLIK
jgi:hypothetical protein